MVKAHDNDDTLVVKATERDDPIEMVVRGAEGMLGRVDTIWVRYDGSTLYRGEQYLADQRGHEQRVYDTQYAVDSYNLEDGGEWQNETPITSGNVESVKNEYPGDVIWEADNSVKLRD